MFLSFFQKTQTITIINEGIIVGEDDFGNDIVTETSTDYQCLVAGGSQGSSIESTNLLQSFDAKVYLPIDASVNSKSRVILNNDEYVIDGIPDRKYSLFSNEFVEPKLVLKLVRKDYA